ncbi:MAG: type II toxin-antitoxin system VapC family toxin [Actinomycetota bacterium]|nr:type II toxin-antitoxin system VapC family toxin [Actinomycetota bacterium]
MNAGRLVCDASALVELLLGTRAGHAVDQALRDRPAADAPALFDIEVCAAARSLVAREVLAASRVEELLADLADLPIISWPHGPLLGRVWALRENMSAYDAVYVALAEVLDAQLVTADRRLAKAVGSVSTVEVIAAV